MKRVFYFNILIQITFILLNTLYALEYTTSNSCKKWHFHKNSNEGSKCIELKKDRYLKLNYKLLNGQLSDLNLKNIKKIK